MKHGLGGGSGRVRGRSSVGGTFFKVGGETVHVKKLMQNLFIKRFTLTIDPILIVLLKLKHNLKCKSGAYRPLCPAVPPSLVRSSWGGVWGVF